MSLKNRSKLKTDEPQPNFTGSYIKTCSGVGPCWLWQKGEKKIKLRAVIIGGSDDRPGN